MKEEISWEITIGFYPGFLIGIRSYQSHIFDDETGDQFLQTDHAFYIPFIDVVYTTYTPLHEG